MRVRKVYVSPIMSDEESDKWQGRLLNTEDCKKLFHDSVDVHDKETGACLAKFRKGVIPGEIQKAAYDNLLSAATPTDNRGVATVKVDGKAKRNKILQSGKRDRVNRAHKIIKSGIIGYFERSQRFPHCRLTAFTKQHMDKFKEAYPIFKLVDKEYEKLMPQHYKKQRKAADGSAQDFVIAGTSFSTITVNKNWVTAVHKDAGDFKEGFGNLVALRKGKFMGGWLVLVKWGVGFDLQNGDLLLMDVHQWHANTPIKGDPGYVRLSLVMYYREKIKYCLTMKEEVKRVQKRRKGDKLNDVDE